MEYTKEMHVWLTNPEEYIKGSIQAVWLDDYGADMESQGWIKIDTVQVVANYELPSREAMRGIAVEKLQDAIRDVDAKAQHVKTQLEGRIQNMLAIGYDEGPKDAVWPFKPTLDANDNIPF